LIASKFNPTCYQFEVLLARLLRLRQEAFPPFGVKLNIKAKAKQFLIPFKRKCGKIQKLK